MDFDQTWYILRERPFNLKRVGGGVWFFPKKNILIPDVAEKKYSDFGGEKKSNVKFWSDKKINILTLVLSEKKLSERKKTHNPPLPPTLQVKWSVP